MSVNRFVPLGVWCAVSLLISSTLLVGQDADDETLDYIFPDRGGFVVAADGSTANELAVAYGRVQSDAGARPESMSVFGFVDSDGARLVELGLPSARPIRTGRISAPFAPGINSGVVFLNPNDAAVQVDFYFSNPVTDELEYNSGSFTLDPGEQMSAFISGEPFNITEVASLATLTFAASLPVAVVAARELRSVDADQPIYTVLPIADLEQTSNETLYFPLFLSGGGTWTTEVVLLNPTDDAIRGTAGFISQGTIAPGLDPAEIEPNPTDPYRPNPGVTPGQTVPVPVGGLASPVNYEIEPRGSFVIATSNIFSAATSTGSLRVVPDSENVAPVASALISSSVVASDGVSFHTLFAGTISPSTRGTAFRTFVEASGEVGSEGSVDTAIAVSNIGGPEIFNDTVVDFQLTDLGGQFVGGIQRVVPSSGQQTYTLSSLFPDIDFNAGFKGILRAETTIPDTAIAVSAIRLRTEVGGRNLLTTIPAVDESEFDTGERYFPYLVHGSDVATEVILFGGSAGQGALSFFSVDGIPVDVELQ